MHKRDKFKDLIFYEIYPTSFYDSNNDGIGDLRGIREKLEYIRDLGFNAVWLNPFYLSPFHDGGYDVKDFYSVDPRFGNMEDYKELLEAAHKMGIRVIIDLVAGHASFENSDFLRSAEAERNGKSDLFIWNNSVWDLPKGYRLISGMFDRDGCYMVNFFAHQPAFNYGFKKIEYPEWQMSYQDERTYAAREYMISVMKYWLSLGTDGFRVDMADSLVKNDDDKSATIEVWQYMFERVRKEYPDAFFVSEWSNPAQALKAGFDADFVLDHWDNFFHRFVRSTEDTRGLAVLNGGKTDAFMMDLKKRLDAAEKEEAFLAVISGNHDTPRISDFLDEKRLKLFYLLQFSLPGIPFVYYGDEIGMKTSPLLSKDGGYHRTGVRTPMQWSMDRNMGFSGYDGGLYLPCGLANRNDADSMIKDENSLYHFLKKLIHIRKEYTGLQEAEYELSEKDRVLKLKRGDLELILNLSDKEVKYEGEVLISTSEKEGVLTSYSGVLIKE